MDEIDLSDISLEDIQSTIDELEINVQPEPEVPTDLSLIHI